MCPSSEHLRQIGGAPPIMAVAHLEYAEPAGRKPDPSFSIGNRQQRVQAMVEFRAQVAAIMGGTAPAPIPIPSSDSKNRPTLRRGARGDLVKEIQEKVDVTADGVFGAGTEAAVREFQHNHGMVPDGIVGPKTWEAGKRARNLDDDRSSIEKVPSFAIPGGFQRAVVVKRAGLQRLRIRPTL